MAIYKRGKFYWFKFVWNGELIRESTKQSNKNVARTMESECRAALNREQQERKSQADKLNCTRVEKCDECSRWFDFSNVIKDGKAFLCSPNCHREWLRRVKPSLTLMDFIETRFEPWAKATFERTSPKTWVGWYRTGLRSIKGSPSLAARELDEITGESIAEFGASKQSDGLQVSSINATLRVLRRVLRIAVEWGVITAAPKVKLLRGEKHRERVVTPEEEARYLAAAPELLATVATILVDSGMRPEECFRLRWESIAWSNGRQGTMQVTHGKTAAARRLIPMTARVRFILEKRWKAAEKPEEGWVFPAPTKSEHVESSSFKKQHAGTFTRINEEVKKENLKAKTEEEKIKPLKAWVLYSFRHTFLTRLGESGCDAWTLARIAGHSNISISQRYVHPSENAVQNAFTRLSGHNSGHTPALKQ
jgi:integrase